MSTGYRPIQLDSLEARDGLLFQKGKLAWIGLPYADWLAKLHGFQHAEELVRHLGGTPRHSRQPEGGWS